MRTAQVCAHKGVHQRAKQREEREFIDPKV